MERKKRRNRYNNDKYTKGRCGDNGSGETYILKSATNQALQMNVVEQSMK